MARRDGFGGEIIHISGLQSRDQLAGKRVCVVGYGKSATDAALESAAVATYRKSQSQHAMVKLAAGIGPAPRPSAARWCVSQGSRVG